MPPVLFCVGNGEGKDDGIPMLVTFKVVGARPILFLPNFVNEKVTSPIPGWSPSETFISLQSDSIRDNELGLREDKGGSHALVSPIPNVVPEDKVLQVKAVTGFPLSSRVRDGREHEVGGARAGVEPTG